MQKITLVMPTCNDFYGVDTTVQVNRIFHNKFIDEIIVLNNCPEGTHSQHVRNMCGTSQARYVEYTEKRGTAPAKNEAIRLSKNKWVLCIDSHVIMYPDSVQSLCDYIQRWNPVKQLIHGPIMTDTFNTVYATHMEPVWRGEMCGIWAKSDEVYKKPFFSIPSSGGGCFALCKDFFPGFHKDFEGFGGEETYLQRKYQKLGGEVICLSALKWRHRFGRVDGLGYQLTVDEKVRNYVIGWQDLGLPLDDIYKEFVGKKLITESRWKRIVSGEWSLKESPKGCNGCNTKSVNELFLEACLKASDINEHLGYMAELAKTCGVIVDCGTTPESLYAFQSNCETVHAIRGEGASLKEELKEADLVFLDTDPHTGEHIYQELTRWKGHCKRYFVMHDTKVFGYDYQGKPGLIAGIERFQAENPQWVTVADFENNNGLRVLSCNPADYPPGLPNMLTRGYNYAKAMAEHLANGNRIALPVTQANRDALCKSNGGRCPGGKRRIDSNECSHCGCPLDKKIPLASSYCPLGYWGPELTE